MSTATGRLWPPIALRAGVTRRVLLLGPWAIKVPRITSHGSGPRGRLWALSRGVQANLSEVEWAGSPGLAPLLRSWCWDMLLVFERAAPVTEADVADWDDIRYGTETGFIAPVDKKPQNLGRLRDGRVVFVDADMSWNDHPPFCCQRHALPPADDDEPAGVAGRDCPDPGTVS